MNSIDRIYPEPSVDATDEELLEWYAPTGSRRVSFNFISSLDGAAALNGRSGGLGNAADQRIFTLLRRHADTIVVGAQTVRTEGYAGSLLDAQAQAWRIARGKCPHPPLAIVSGSLALDPLAEVFTRAPVRPLVLTTAAAAADRRRALEPVADVIDCGQDRLDPHAVVAQLGSRGLRALHCEGGPSLFATFQAGGLADELCLTLAPSLVGGRAPRIAAGSADAPSEVRGMDLVHILRSDSMLFLRYLAPTGR